MKMRREDMRQLIREFYDGEVSAEAEDEPGLVMGHGGSARTARQHLFDLASRAQSLHDRLSDDDELPEWVQGEIAVMADKMDTVADHLGYQLQREACQKLYGAGDEYEGEELEDGYAVPSKLREPHGNKPSLVDVDMEEACDGFVDGMKKGFMGDDDDDEDEDLLTADDTGATPQKPQCISSKDLRAGDARAGATTSLSLAVTPALSRIKCE